MNPIMRKTVIAGQLLVGFVTLTFNPLTAQAQFVPGRNYYSYYPDAGVMGLATSAYSSAVQQNTYMQDRQLQATSSMARSLTWQNINKSMQAEASARAAAVPDSGQAARDWMIQNTASSRPARRPMTLPANELAVVTPSRESVKPAAPKEIMLWPTLLKEQRFDEDRSDVEAPFRRAYADKKPLTIEDYQMIIRSVEKIKATVKTMESQLVETEYTSVQKYLDDLIADAEKRIQARERTETRD